MGAQDVRPLEPRSRAAAIGVLVASMLIGAGVGLWRGGSLGGLFGILIGSALGVLVYMITRLLALRDGIRDGHAPDVAGLPPRQALTVLSSMAGRAGGGPLFGSEILDGIAEAEVWARERGDISGAISKLEALARRHPRSPAIPARIARFQREDGDIPAGLRATRQAIELAISGGMNAVAVRAFEALGESTSAGSASEDMYADLDLNHATLAALGRALDAHGDAGGARWRRRRDEIG